MSRKNQETVFIRRKFTITETLDEVLQDLAEQNYQGNVSLCLRAAIEDHRATLDGTDTGLMTQQLITRVNEIKTQQDRLMNTVKTITEDHGQRSAETRTTLYGSLELTDEENRILAALKTAEAGFRINDLAEELGLPTSRILPALGTLVDQALVTTDSKSSQRFRLAGYTAHDLGEEE